VFNEGQYAPKTENGKKLLAHELTHVVQQRDNGILRKRVQRQHIQLNSGRFVGDTVHIPLNLKEDVIEALDSLHVLWSISNADYASEYATVRSAPDMSEIPKATIPKTIAAIRNNENPILNDQVALSVFGLTISASVGSGGTNTKNDILRLQNYLHARWFLSNTDYQVERAAVNAGSDPVNTATISRTLAGLTRLKVSKVAEGYRRHDILTGTHAITASERSSVEAALIPGASVSSSGSVTLPSPDPICSSPATLGTEIRATMSAMRRPSSWVRWETA
jgi:hypothetical protein